MLARTTMTAVAALALTVGGCTTTTAAEGGASGEMMSDAEHIAMAVANPARPDDQVADDANRKPAEMLAFAGVEPGDKIGELIPGGGYFTRIFSAAVGARRRDGAGDRG